MEWYVFDCMEMIMGPYESKDAALKDMKLHIDELYLLDHYTNPYVDCIEEDYYNWEDEDYSNNRLLYEYDLGGLEDLPSKAKFNRKEKFK